MNIMLQVGCGFLANETFVYMSPHLVLKFTDIQVGCVIHYLPPASLKSRPNGTVQICYYYYKFAF